MANIKVLHANYFQNLKIQDMVHVDKDHAAQQDALTFTTNRYNQMEKFVKESLIYDRFYFQGEKKTLDGIIVTLTQQCEQMQNKINQNHEQKIQVENEKNEAHQELIKAKEYKPLHQEDELNNLIKEIKAKIITLNKGRLDQAQQINTNDLKNLSIKNKDKESEVNELWIWIMVVIYKEPASQYYWANFKAQVFDNPEAGKDFKERLGRIKAIDMKKDEIERTSKLLKLKDKILASDLLIGNIKTNLEIIFKIVEMIMQTEELGCDIHKNELLLKQIQGEKVKQEQDLVRLNDKVKILQDRIDFLEIVVQEYKFMDETMKKKIHSYQQAQQLNERFIDQMDGIYLNLDYSKSYDQSYVPPPVQTVKHQKIDEQVLDQQLEKYEHQILQDEQQQQPQQQQQQNETIQPEQPQEKAIEVQNAQFNEIPQTDIRETKTGGCEACNVF